MKRQVSLSYTASCNGYVPWLDVTFHLALVCVFMSICVYIFIIIIMRLCANQGVVSSFPPEILYLISQFRWFYHLVGLCTFCFLAWFNSFCLAVKFCRRHWWRICASELTCHPSQYFTSFIRRSSTERTVVVTVWRTMDRSSRTQRVGDLWKALQIFVVPYFLCTSWQWTKTW